jgi:hypothetical protein
MKEKEGFMGLILVLASVYYFVDSINMLRIYGGFGIVQAIFLMILSLVGIALGFLLGFTLLMKAGTTLPDAPSAPGFPVTPDASGAGSPPPVPATPAAPAANAAAALNMVRVPLGFAGLGLGLIVYIFSFFTPTIAAVANADAAFRRMIGG